MNNDACHLSELVKTYVWKYTLRGLLMIKLVILSKKGQFGQKRKE